MPNSGIIFTGQSGCLLPILIIFNLFFGHWIFHSIGWWLGIEAILVILFMLKIRSFIKKINVQFGSASGSYSSGPRSNNPFTHKRGKVIDVDAEEVQDKPKLP